MTKSRHSFVIEQENLSYAWAVALDRLLTPGTERLTPLVVSVTGFDNSGTPKEDARILELLDNELLANKLFRVQTVANTLFPKHLWDETQPREVLYDRYLGILPRLKKRRQNRYGIYFERLIAYDSSCSHSNQIEHIITTYRRGVHRASALQAAIFDPNRDHTSARRRGFPCLGHVAFESDQANQSLSVTGFYTSQDVFAKAYGNYRGLCLLGAFVGHEIGLKLSRMTCISATAHLGEASKTSLRALSARTIFVANERTAASDAVAPELA
jgi:hypothetical protein